MSIVYLTFFPV